MRMALDLGDPNWTAEITPNGGSETDERMSHDLVGFKVHLTAMVE